MSKFRKKGKGETPGISTASLPDIVFMLLFFFMVTTVMRETTLRVNIRLPQATEVSKLERKSLVSYIYAGKPTKQYQSKYGIEDRIQLNDQIAIVDDIKDFIIAERAARKEEEVPLLTTSIKSDQETKMGLISDIKQELRKVQAYKINYSSARKIDN